MREILPTYEGNENYIFISYSHKDTDKVIPIMETLRDLGCRIWYDEGIVPGSEWPEDIAQHLNNCAMVLAFISPNSMESVNCRREINFALSKQKPFLSVVLEPTQMPLGMELQLSTQQSVLRYNYRTEAQFLEKICTSPDLIRCMESPKNVAEIKSAVQQPSDGATEPKSVKSKSSKTNGKLPAIIAGILVVVVLIVMLLLPKNGGADAAPETTGAAADTITVYGQFDTWKKPYCWAWNSERDVFEAWPGEPMEPEGSGYIMILPRDVTGLKFSDPIVGMETDDINVEAGWDIWVVEKAGYYAWFYEEPTESMLAEAFG